MCNNSTKEQDWEFVAASLTGLVILPCNTYSSSDFYMLINNCVWKGTDVQDFSNWVPVYLRTEDMGMLPSCAGCYLKLYLFVS